jgi:Zn-dependent protease with chaperone function
MPEAANGRWMDGESAQDHAARGTVDGADLVISSGDGSRILARWPIRELRLDAMHEGGVVHVECARAPGALLTLDDPLFAKALRGSGAAIRGLSVGRRGLVVGVACLAAFAALMGGFYAAAPWLSAKAARRVPLSTERNMASGMVPLFARKTCRTPAAEQAVGQMLRRLDPGGALQVDVRVVNIRMANAFALPGGIVLLTRGLLEEADGPDEVAGVLAHELAHVQHRHALAHMIRSALLGGLWAATLGDYSGLMIVDPKTAYETVTLKYSREAEAEADATALRMLSERGISSQGLVNFLQRNGKGESTTATWLSSHPASEDRVARLSRQDLRHRGAPVLDPETFYHLRNACEAVRELSSVRELFF